MGPITGFCRDRRILAAKTALDSDFCALLSSVLMGRREVVEAAGNKEESFRMIKGENAVDISKKAARC